MKLIKSVSNLEYSVELFENRDCYVVRYVKDGIERESENIIGYKLADFMFETKYNELEQGEIYDS